MLFIVATGLPFNFLASLINGNIIADFTFAAPFFSFNFLASLINGNIIIKAKLGADWGDDF